MRPQGVEKNGEKNMAYLEFAECGGPSAGTGPQDPHAAVRFSPLEWWVIAAAQRDRLASIEEPGPVARLLGSLFSSNDNGRQADPRLEALRRMAVLAWHKSYVIPKWEIRAFLEAGFSLDHYELLQASIASSKARHRSARAAAGRARGRFAVRDWVELEASHGLS